MKYAVVYGNGADSKTRKEYDVFGEALKVAKEKYRTDGYAFSNLYDNDPAGETALIWTSEGIEGEHFVGEYFVELGSCEIMFEQWDKMVFG